MVISPFTTLISGNVAINKFRLNKRKEVTDQQGYGRPEESFPHR